MTKVAEIRQSRIAAVGDEIRDVIARISVGSAQPEDLVKLNVLISERVKMRVETGLRAAQERAKGKTAARRASTSRPPVTAAS